MKKKILVLALAVSALTLMAGSAHAVTKVLISSAASTTTGPAVSLGSDYKDFTVDIVTLGTGSVVVRVDGNASNDGVFDNTGLGDTIACDALKCTAVYNSQPMLQLRGVITSATGTNSTTVTVTGAK